MQHKENGSCKQGGLKPRNIANGCHFGQSSFRNDARTDVAEMEVDLLRGRDQICRNRSLLVVSGPTLADLGQKSVEIGRILAIVGPSIEQIC